MVGLGPSLVPPRAAARRCASVSGKKCINDRRRLIQYNGIFLSCFTPPRESPLMSEANVGVTEANGVSEGEETRAGAGFLEGSQGFFPELKAPEGRRGF